MAYPSYPSEYMTGLIMAAAAFITLAGILIALRIATVKEKGTTWITLSLVTSFTAGLTAIIIALGWFFKPGTLEIVVVPFLLGLQVILIYIPILVFVFARARWDSSLG